MVETRSEISKINDSFFKELLSTYQNGVITVEGVDFVLSNKYNINVSVTEFVEKDFKSNDKNELTINQNLPLISVIIPTFNRRQMLKEAINSVLKQSYTNYEIIVIDDGSTDGTEQMLKKNFEQTKVIKYKQVVNSKDAGKNRNIGYNLAKGDYVIFLDDDDFYIDKDFFMKAIYKHLEFDNLAFVCANSLVFQDKSKDFIISNLNKDGLQDSKEYLMNFGINFDKPKSTFTTVFNKRLLDKSDFKSMMMMNDTPIYLRALLHGKVFILNDIVGVYRVHDNNISKNINLNFIIKNLEEKKWVYQKIEDKVENPNKWLIEQLMITIHYYIYGSNPNFKNVKKLVTWNNNNNSGAIKIKINLKIIKSWLNNSFTSKSTR